MFKAENGRSEGLRQNMIDILASDDWKHLLGSFRIAHFVMFVYDAHAWYL